MGGGRGRRGGGGGGYYKYPDMVETGGSGGIDLRFVKVRDKS